MNKTRIEWCDSTWNPVTGCLHGCLYCYAKRIHERFNGAGSFTPQFHEGRLAEPQKAKRPQDIFVCSMADLFGSWVPDAWIQAVLDACKAAPQHRYIFLTKNPERYGYINCDGQAREECRYGNACDGGCNEHGHRLLELYSDDDEPFPALMLGATATTNVQLDVAYESMAGWLSIEPMLERLYTDEAFGVQDLYSEYPRWQWVVLGAETGSRPGKVVPKREWVEAIVEECRAWKTPVFMKDSLAGIWGEPLIRQYPWEKEK